MLKSLKRKNPIGPIHQMHAEQGLQKHIPEKTFLIFLNLCSVDTQVPAGAVR